MKVFNFLIATIDKIQAIYEFCVKVMGHIIRFINRIRLIIVKIIDYIRRLIEKPENLEYLMSNYAEEEHYFI